MSVGKETITVDKQTLLGLLVALERQETFQLFALQAYAQQLNALAENLESLYNNQESLRLKHALLALFLSDAESRLIFTDEQLETWQSEFEMTFSQNKSKLQKVEN